MIAGFCGKNIIAPVIFEGNCNKDVFEAYIENMSIKDFEIFFDAFYFTLQKITSYML